MRNQLCALLLLCAWFVVQAAEAQTQPRGALTPEQAKRQQEVAELNKMLELRKNNKGNFSKEQVRAMADTKAIQQNERNLSPCQRDFATRRQIEAYFKAHPEESAKYEGGGLPALTGADAVLYELNVSSLSEINFEGLTEKQQIQMLESDETTKEQLKAYAPKMKHLDKAEQARVRLELWEQMKQNQR